MRAKTHEATLVLWFMVCAVTPEYPEGVRLVTSSHHLTCCKRLTGAFPRFHLSGMHLKHTFSLLVLVLNAFLSILNFLKNPNLY